MGISDAVPAAVGAPVSIPRGALEAAHTHLTLRGSSADQRAADAIARVLATATTDSVRVEVEPTPPPPGLTLEEMAEALWATHPQAKTLPAWAELVAEVDGGFGSVARGLLIEYRARAAAILARLAPRSPAGPAEGARGAGAYVGAPRELLSGRSSISFSNWWCYNQPRTTEAVDVARAAWMVALREGHITESEQRSFEADHPQAAITRGSARNLRALARLAPRSPAGPAEGAHPGLVETVRAAARVAVAALEALQYPEVSSVALLEAIVALRATLKEEEAERGALAAEGGADGWCFDMERAPYGREVEVRTGAMTFRAELVAGASINPDGASCDQWRATREGEHPPSWTDGACWESNEDLSSSLQPDGWRPPPPAQPSREG